MKLIQSLWWRHQMEIFSALLAICAGNSPVSGEFPAQRPVTRSFDIFFDLRLNKRLSKQPWGWWFETPSCPLWRQCNVNSIPCQEPNPTHRNTVAVIHEWTLACRIRQYVPLHIRGTNILYPVCGYWHSPDAHFTRANWEGNAQVKQTSGESMVEER